MIFLVVRIPVSAREICDGKISNLITMQTSITSSQESDYSDKNCNAGGDTLFPPNNFEMPKQEYYNIDAKKPATMFIMLIKIDASVIV